MKKLFLAIGFAATLFAASMTTLFSGSAYAETLYSCIYNSSSGSYRENEIGRMRALGAVCNPVSGGERVTCAMNGTKLDYLQSEVAQIMRTNPDAVCETETTLILPVVVIKQAAPQVSTLTPTPARSSSGAFNLVDKVVVYFYHASSQLGSEEFVDLDRFAQKYRNTGHYFTITGYTDASGSSGFNHTLSLKRAGRVRDAIHDSGISIDKIVSVNALGEQSQRARTRNGRVLAYNRAVEVRAYR